MAIPDCPIPTWCGRILWHLHHCEEALSIEALADDLGRLHGFATPEVGDWQDRVRELLAAELVGQEFVRDTGDLVLALTAAGEERLVGDANACEKDRKAEAFGSEEAVRALEFAERNRLSGPESAVERAILRATVKVISDEADRDPVKWVEVTKPKIEDKNHGLIRFEPWPYQCYIMRAVAQGKKFIVPKSRQTGVTTCIMVASDHSLLKAVPFHLHVVANKLETCLDRCLKIARLALSTAEISEEERRRLTLGSDHAVRMEYNGPLARNYIMAHGAVEDAGRSFDGNAFLMEEVAVMPKVGNIYTSLKYMVSDAKGYCGMVSTYCNDLPDSGRFFEEMVDAAELQGIEVIPIDWRSRPDRDQAWYDSELASAQAMGREDEFFQEHCLLRRSAGERFFDQPGIIRQWSDAKVQFPGSEPTAGHLYSIGVDCSFGGEAKMPAVVVDLAARPRQVVEIRFYRYQQGRGRSSTEQRVDFMEAVAKEFPGRIYIDGTGNKTLPALVRVERKCAVHMSYGHYAQPKKSVDHAEGMVWIHVPRATLIGWCKSNLERGVVLASPAQFPQLYEALASATMDWVGSARKMVSIDKKAMRGADVMDALALANIPLAITAADDRSRAADTQTRPSPIIAARGHRVLPNLRGKKW